MMMQANGKKSATSNKKRLLVEMTRSCCNSSLNKATRPRSRRSKHVSKYNELREFQLSQVSFIQIIWISTSDDLPCCLRSPSLTLSVENVNSSCSLNEIFAPFNVDLSFFGILTLFECPQ